MQNLLQLIREKQIRENEHAELLMKKEACIDIHVNSWYAHNPELTDLERAELSAAKTLKLVEDALVNYIPATAQEFAMQSSAIIGVFGIVGIVADNENELYLKPVTSGAEALASGGLK